MKTLISKNNAAANNSIFKTFKGFSYDAAQCDVVCANGFSVGLRPQSVRVFQYLADHCDRVVPRNELLDHVWGDTVVTGDSVTQCISEIRTALKDANRTALKTVTKRGYRLIEDHGAAVYPVEFPEQAQADRIAR